MKQLFTSYMKGGKMATIIKFVHAMILFLSLFLVVTIVRGKPAFLIFKFEFFTWYIILHPRSVTFFLFLCFFTLQHFRDVYVTVIVHHHCVSQLLSRSAIILHVFAFNGYGENIFVL